MTTEEKLRALDQEIAKQVPEKTDVATTLAKNSITRYGEAGLCYRQAGIAYSQGKEEEGKCLMKVAPGYDRSARSLIRAVIALRNEMTARSEGQVEIANNWHQLATLYQSVADHKLQAAVALLEGRAEEAKAFTEKATRLEEGEIEELREKLAEACDGIEPLFELEDGF